MDNQQRTPPPIDQQKGSSRRDELPEYFGTDETEAQVTNLTEMINRDATAQALINVIMLPILSAGWTITPHEEEPEGEDSPTNQVIGWLTKPPVEGGMTSSFEVFLAQCLSAIGIGFAAFEKVWMIDPEGNTVYKKLSFMPPETVEIKQDDFGGFDGFKQEAIIGEDTKEVEIPVESGFLFTHQKHIHNLRGKSSLATSWPYYQWKRRYYYLMQEKVQFEAFGQFKVFPLGNKDPKAMPTKVSKEKIDDMATKVVKLKGKGAVGLPDGLDVDHLTLPSDTSILEIVEHMNREMATSILADFIMLGQGNVGSWALSQDKSSFFLQSLYQLKQNLETHINNWIIPDLYFWNFGENAPAGRFQINDFVDEAADFVKSTFEELLQTETLTEEAAEALGQRAISLFGIEEGIEQIFETRAAESERNELEEDPDQEPEDEEEEEPEEEEDEEPGVPPPTP